MADRTSECQIETAKQAGWIRRPGVVFILQRIVSSVAQYGVRYTLGTKLKPKIGRMLGRVGLKQPAPRSPACPDEVLDLQPGEWVEVRPLEEILQTLDPYGRRRGLVFTPEMKQHCGKRYRVFRRMELMFDESSRVQRRVKNTVLLEGVFCHGEGIGCDRSCFHYWREVWLKRVVGNQRIPNESRTQSE